MLKRNKKLKQFLIVIIPFIIALFIGAGIDIAIRPTEEGGLEITSTFSMTLSPEQLPATLVNDEGETVVDENIVTVEAVEGNQIAVECPEGEPDCGQGHYIYAPTSTWQEFKDYTLGGCWDVDSAYGGQCYDLAALFWMNYTKDGRTLSTCGTGAASGTWNCKEYNAGDDFELIYDATNLQPGDWLVFSGGQYGHIGMAVGNYNNGYITLLGENQGGTPCVGGGASTNIINISLQNFLGAFRPKSYVVPPTPIPTPIPITGCADWDVVEGDTMSGIMLSCEGVVVYGEAMNQYADSWYSQNYNPGKSVYWGWTHGSGYGLYNGDYLLHEVK